MGKGFDVGVAKAASFEKPWYTDLDKLTNEELLRMYTVIADGRYTFARNAWYIPIGGDQRCPIMVAKGFRSPDTLDRMAEFRTLRSFWRLNSGTLSMPGTLDTSQYAISKMRF